MITFSLEHVERRAHKQVRGGRCVRRLIGQSANSRLLETGVITCIVTGHHSRTAINGLSSSSSSSRVSGGSVAVATVLRNSSVTGETGGDAGTLREILVISTLSGVHNITKTYH